MKKNVLITVCLFVILGILIWQFFTLQPEQPQGEIITQENVLEITPDWIRIEFQRNSQKTAVWSITDEEIRVATREEIIALGTVSTFVQWLDYEEFCFLIQKLELEKYWKEKP